MLFYIFMVNRHLLEGDPIFSVPRVVPELSTKEVLTTELVDGVSLEKMENVSQEKRNEVQFCKSMPFVLWHVSEIHVLFIPNCMIVYGDAGIVSDL